MIFRRLFSFSIDIFITYAITRLLLFVLMFVEQIYSFELVFVICGMFYYVFANYAFKRTIGYFLLNIKITNHENKELKLTALLKRELFGKWIFTIIFPIILLQLIFGKYWINSVYDFYILIIIFLINLISLFIFKRTWYDLFSKSHVVRSVSSTRAKAFSFITIIIFFSFIIFSFIIEYKKNGWVSCKLSAYQSSLSANKYVDFLKTQQTSPKDYILKLFETKDIVVLCERTHNEATQWDLIYDVVSDSNFINSVGLIYTEYGQLGMQDTLDSLMFKKDIDDIETEKLVLSIVRNDAVWPYSDLYCFYKFLKKLALLNKELPVDKKIHYQFTDAKVNWYNMTKESYKTYIEKLLVNRDEIMANSIIADLSHRKKHQKCLVIMNDYHAWNLMKITPIPKWKSTYFYLKEKFKERASNVLINSRIFGGFPPIANGIWDEAFRKNGNRQVGFNFENTVFGEDKFDMMNYIRISTSPFNIDFYGNVFNNVKYNDVFDGFVFINPIEKQYYEEGIPGYTNTFEKELLRRCKFLDDDGRIYQFAQNDIQEQPEYPIKRKISGALIIENVIELGLFFLFSLGFLISIIVFVFFRKK